MINSELKVKIHAMIDSVAQEHLRENYKIETCKESGWSGYPDGAFKKAKENALFEIKQALKCPVEFHQLDQSHDLIDEDLKNEDAIKEYIASL